MCYFLLVCYARDESPQNFDGVSNRYGVVCLSFSSSISVSWYTLINIYIVSTFGKLIYASKLVTEFSLMVT